MSDYFSKELEESLQKKTKLEEQLDQLSKKTERMELLSKLAADFSNYFRDSSFLGIESDRNEMDELKTLEKRREDYLNRLEIFGDEMTHSVNLIQPLELIKPPILPVSPSPRPSIDYPSLTLGGNYPFNLPTIHNRFDANHNSLDESQIKDLFKQLLISLVDFLKNFASADGIKVASDIPPGFLGKASSNRLHSGTSHSGCKQHIENISQKIEEICQNFNYSQIKSVHERESLSEEDRALKDDLDHFVDLLTTSQLDPDSDGQELSKMWFKCYIEGVYHDLLRHVWKRLNRKYTDRFRFLLHEHILLIEAYRMEYYLLRRRLDFNKEIQDLAVKKQLSFSDDSQQESIRIIQGILNSKSSNESKDLLNALLFSLVAVLRFVSAKESEKHLSNDILDAVKRVLELEQS